MKAGKSKRKATIVMLVLAGVLICAGAVMAVGTSLRTSGTYTSEMDTPELALSLQENDKPVSGNDTLLKNLLGNDSTIKIGKIYNEKLTVSNTSETDQYVRMTVRKYWLVEEGSKKRVDLVPKYIVLQRGENGWIEDEKAAADGSPEREVFYYTKPLSGGQETEPAVTGIGLDRDVAKIIERTKSESDNGTTITTTYTYAGLQFGIKVDVDGIQTHSAKEAAKSVWGVDINVANDGTLSLE